MNGIISSSRRASVIDIPVNFAQTELAAGTSLIVATVVLGLQQRLELRALTAHIVRLLTPTVTPAYLNTSIGLFCAGLYAGKNILCPLAYASSTDQTSITNPFVPCTICTPGTYSIIVSNNASNTGISCLATGSLKLYL